MKKRVVADIPFTLAGFFDDSDEDRNIENLDEINNFENQELVLGNVKLIIRQTVYHPTNANIVWPSTFVLADYIKENVSNIQWLDTI
jgi:hypothetical protein